VSAGSDADWALPADAGAAGVDAGDVAPPEETAVSPVVGPPEGGSIAASLPVGAELAQQRPEVLVGAAFAGAFLFARILKHITSE
jgi:hypothetical protein